MAAGSEISTAQTETLCDVEIIELPALLMSTLPLMLVYINKASSDELQHPAKRGSKPLFAISAHYVCGGNFACLGRKEVRKVGVDEAHRRGVKRRRLSCKCRCVS